MKIEHKSTFLFLALSAVLTLLVKAVFGVLANLVAVNPQLESIISPDTTFTYLNASFVSMGIALFVVMLYSRMFKPLLALLLYCIVQVSCSVFLPLFVPAASLYSGGTFNGTAMSVLLLVSSLLTILVLHSVKLIDVKNTGLKSLTVPSSLHAISAVVFLMFASSLSMDWLDLENFMADEFVAMAVTLPGMLAIGVFGPITEEYLFREAIQGGMLRQGLSPWFACVVSALVFGLVHGNPAQIPFAFVVGLIFAVVYYHTRSIIPVAICHIINNSTSVVLMNIYSDNPDIKAKDFMGGETAVFVCFAVFLVLGLFLFWTYCKRRV